jgi:YfiH family protein
MLRFREFESLGLGLAAITDAADGDFARPGGRPEKDAFALAGLASRPVATLRQVHGTRVETAELGNLELLAGREGDALITRDSRIAIAVRVADCVPVFLFDPGSRVAGIVHAGRRGTFDGAAGATVRAMRDRFGVVPANVAAVIGPSAGPCCYEVDEPTAARYRELGYPAAGRRLDLWRGNSIQLESEGLCAGNIAVAGLCTICGGQFHSYRATHTAARNLAILAV